MERSVRQLRFSPRPRASKVIRKLSWTASLAYIEHRAARAETRDWDGEFGVDFQNSDWFTAGYTNTYEFLPRPFPIATRVTLPVGGYEFASARARLVFGQQRPVSGNLSIEYGTFYSGNKTTIGVSRGRVKPTSQLSLEPSFSLNRIDLTEGTFATRLIGSRVTYTMTPLMFVSALVQYNSGANAIVANIRLRWEYQPGSELFIVFNEQRDTLAPRFPALANLAVIVKVNRLLRF